MPEYYRFRVRLLDVDADLSRTFLLKKAATFADLHAAIQDACGWLDCHLYLFQDDGTEEALAGIPDEDGWGPPTPDAKKVKLSSYWDGPGKCSYLYDFGDGWEHEVVLEGIEQRPERFTRRLLAGSGTFPPEDCGGVPGYERCVAVVKGEDWLPEYGDEEERRELVEWLGRWRPDSFDLAEVQREFDRKERATLRALPPSDPESGGGR